MENVTEEFLSEKAQAAAEAQSEETIRSLGLDPDEQIKFLANLSNGRASDEEEAEYLRTHATRSLTRTAYTNSPLVQYTCISPNCNDPRYSEIDTITIHEVWGELSMRALGDIFLPVSRQASSNYGVCTDGIALYVPERARAWTSGSTQDYRAVTIEVSNSRTYPNPVSAKVYNQLIQLCADICIRNGKTKMIWCGSLEATNRRKFAKNEMRMTLHRWFQATDCPGDWLTNHMQDIANRTNALIAKKLSPFTDVKVTDPKYKHIRNCYDAGIIKGYPDGTFRPKNKLTRGDMCIIVDRILKKEGVKIVNKEVLPFSDVTKENPKYKYIKDCYDAGLINGYPDGTFRPDDDITREDACVIISKLLKKL